MNTKNMRLTLAFLLALGMLGMSGQTAQATPPEHFVFQVVFTDTFEELCEFPVDISVDALVSGTAHFDKEGSLFMVLNHITEVDSLTANGKTVQGLPFTYDIQVHYDSEENPVSWHGTGLIVKFLLPDGSLFISAGFTDWLAHAGEEVVLVADHGKTADVELLCAALAP